MNLRRVAHLGWRSIRTQLRAWAPILLFAGALVYTLGLHRGAHGLTLFGLDWPPGDALRFGAQEAANRVVRESFSSVWLGLILFYLAPKLLFPLADSFSTNQLLWLRLTPCTAVEIAAARALTVVSAAGWVSLWTTGWALVAFARLDVPPPFLVENVVGIGAYVLLCGGCLLILCDLLAHRDSISRPLVFASLFAPICIALTSTLSARETRLWLPYTSPYLVMFLTPRSALAHALSAAAAGILLLVLHIFLAAVRQPGGFALRRGNHATV